MGLWGTGRRRSGNIESVLSLKVPVRMRSGSISVESRKREYINHHLAHNRHPNRPPMPLLCASPPLLATRQP